MKKALMLIASVAALSASSNAMAWGVGSRGLVDLTGRIITADGLGPLGVVDMVTPVGRNGAYCTYLMNWASPYNPNNVTACVLHEARTALNPSCIGNAYIGTGTSTVVLAGDGYGFCEGFDLLGVPLPVTIIAGSRGNLLAGVAIFDGCTALPFEIC